MRLRTFCLVLAAVSLAISQSPDFPAMQYKVDPDWPALPAGWNFGEAPGVAVDAKGHVFVLHRGEHPIMEFTSDGRLIRSWGEGLFIRPHGIRIDPEGNIWTVDNDTHQVMKMDPSGRVRMVIGRKGFSGETEEAFNRPTDVAFGPNGEIYVADGYVNSRVVKFTKEGRYVTAWGKKGKGEGEFNLPHSVAVDKQGRVYVGDRENYRLQIFDANGKFLQQWTHVGSPWGLDMQPDQTLFIADGYNDRILKVNLEGKVLGAFGHNGRLLGEFSYLHHLELDSTGNIYTGEIKNQRIQKFSPR
jgi:DNA-binding beta-propeller fold protein YncE